MAYLIQMSGMYGGGGDSTSIECWLFINPLPLHPPPPPVTSPLERREWKRRRGSSSGGTGACVVHDNGENARILMHEVRDRHGTTGRQVRRQVPAYRGSHSSKYNFN